MTRLSSEESEAFARLVTRVPRFTLRRNCDPRGEGWRDVLPRAWELAADGESVVGDSLPDVVGALIDKLSGRPKFLPVLRDAAAGRGWGED